MTRWIAGALIFVAMNTAAAAHELRPAFLDIKEVSENRFAVLWKVPVVGQRWLSLELNLPNTCAEAQQAAAALEGNYHLSRWQVDCPGGLKGQVIAIDGLRTSLTDVLARIEYLGGTSEVARLTPEMPSFPVTGQMNLWETARTYFVLGVEHILSGIDHLLFVLALMLLIRGRWALFKTITAFTIAHSITLSGAALGYMSLPQPPVEVVIALSIAFVARELALRQAGETRLSERYPWIVAFVFGLLHGFGFAGALKEVGLPQSDVPMALLTFNLGVETGQLLFVAAVLAVFRLSSGVIRVPAAPARLAASYAIGAMSVYWLVSRLIQF